MSVESWNSFFQWGSVGLVALTFFLGAGALWTGNRINARQTERLITLEADLA
jgi:ABC-type transport system involved in cytochrome c biogenesis permease subunit